MSARYRTAFSVPSGFAATTPSSPAPAGSCAGQTSETNARVNRTPREMRAGYTASSAG